MAQKPGALVGTLPVQSAQRWLWSERNGESYGGHAQAPAKSAAALQSTRKKTPFQPGLIGKRGSFPVLPAEQKAVDFVA
ncbi:hypothetical protein [Mesorhizobium sp. WSM4313]|uniref:hypothetical protein n=1 Tax=Mesorhizobium sp. WSM4313 TaxID=2029412 RepID=UPI001140B82C|nr:hypothetical protein [Mesorhizobium sp. WSM4313]